MKSPGFTSVTALTLALGIGAGSGIFTVIDGVILKPLSYPDADRLVAVNHSAPGINFPDAGSSPSFYFTYREKGQAFAASGIWRARAAVITGVGEPEEIRAIDLTGDVLSALGIAPLIGRAFSAADGSPSAPETMVLTWGYWKERFGGESGVLGPRVIVDGIAREIIGVMPRSFRFLTEHASIIRPLQFDRTGMALGDFSYRGIARLKPGVTVAAARADLARLIPVAIETFPPSPGYSRAMYVDARFRPDLRPLKDDVIGNIGKTLWALLGTVSGWEWQFHLDGRRYCALRQRR